MLAIVHDVRRGDGFERSAMRLVMAFVSAKSSSVQLRLVSKVTNCRTSKTRPPWRAAPREGCLPTQTLFDCGTDQCSIVLESVELVGVGEETDE